VNQASTLNTGASMNNTNNAHPSFIKRPRPKLTDDHEKFDGKDLSLYPQFRGKLEATMPKPSVPNRTGFGTPFIV